jgi:hypothetical protein
MSSCSECLLECRAEASCGRGVGCLVEDCSLNIEYSLSMVIYIH